MLTQRHLSVSTRGRGLINITDDVTGLIETTAIITGVCHLFLHHTSASLILCENADHLVLRDLEAFMQRLVPEDDPLYQHTAEGPDDMPSHVRTILTQSSLMIPITNHKLGLGTWQGIYLWEHRFRHHQRQLTVTLWG